jgi:molybdopterin-guanine dinucleotide biosynthesis protein A
MIHTDKNSSAQSALHRGTPRRAYVLAGGVSRRMGCDKLFVTVDGEPLLARTLRICRAVFSEVSIVAKGAEKFSEFDTPVIIDYPNAPGPLGGIIAALVDCTDCTDCSGDSCFIIAADFADIDEETIRALQQDYHGEDYLGIREQGGIQPLCGIYSTKALGELLAVAAKDRSYHLWRIVERLNSRFLPLQKALWRNINTPADAHKQLAVKERQND